MLAKSILLTVLAFVAAAGATAWLCIRTGNVKHQIEIVDPEIELGETPIGKDITIEFSVKNAGFSVKEIVGGTGTCGKTGCIRLDGIRVAVPPGQTLNVSMGLYIAFEGPYDLSANLYVEDDGLVQLPVRIRGSGKSHNLEK